jgi:putative endonuclease
MKKQDEKQWVVYLLECLDGSYYTGITNNVEKRMDAHASGNGSKYVRCKGFGHLIATKVCCNKSDASKAECLVKNLHRSKKINWFVD